MNKNTKTLYITLSVLIGMFCLAFASVPLYNIFCKVTGYGGTVQQSDTLPQYTGKKEFQISFNADISPDLNWHFKPVQKNITTVAGKQNLVFYETKNLSDSPLTGTATYNVVPEKAAKYFSKIDCFCFTKQLLQPNKTTSLPVSFYIDPEIENDPFLRDVSQITLSYSFFKSEN